MEKYEKNRNLKPDTLVKTITSIASVALLLVGVIGIAVQFFRDDGWLRQLLSKMLDSNMGLASIPLVILVLYFINRWASSAADGKASTRGNLPLYIMMLIGAFFLFRIITTGDF
ncbi:MAG TPA: hypothetical protein VK974_07785 [Methylophilaceae bacterium]|nr:hypothetical protein [Methylophilaceae bacterium]